MASLAFKFEPHHSAKNKAEKGKPNLKWEEKMSESNIVKLQS